MTHKRGSNLPPSTIYRINTGAPLPEGADSVIMVEDTQLVSTVSQNPDEELEVRTLAQVPAGENVRTPGSDVRYGTLVLNRGALLSGTGGEIGTLAFVGRKEVLSDFVRNVNVMTLNYALGARPAKTSRRDP